MMKRYFLALCVLATSMLCVSCRQSSGNAQSSTEPQAQSEPEHDSPLYAIEVSDADDQPVLLRTYAGQVLLIVNTATRCGFTPQYTELERIYATYRDRGFTVLDFPCNQFGQQAPGTIGEIHEFCTANYDIQFPQFAKVEVNGENAAPLFTYLKAQKGFEGFDADNALTPRLEQKFDRGGDEWRTSSDIKWNFTKFLVDRQGNVVARFEPTHSIDDIEEQVKRLL